MLDRYFLQAICLFVYLSAWEIDVKGYCVSFVVVKATDTKLWLDFLKLKSQVSYQAKHYFEANVI